MEYDDPGIENGASDQAYRAAEGTADFKKMYFQRSRRKEAGRISSQEPESAGKIDGSTLDDEEVEYSLISQKAEYYGRIPYDCMNSLVNKRYVERHRSEEDRRVVLVKLTEKV